MSARFSSCRPSSPSARLLAEPRDRQPLSLARGRRGVGAGARWRANDQVRREKALTRIGLALLAKRDINISLYVRARFRREQHCRSISRSDPEHPSGCRRGDAPAHPGPPDRWRAFRFRSHGHPWAVAAPHFAPPQAAGRRPASWSATAKGAWAFFRLTDRGEAARTLRPMLDEPRPVRSASSRRSDAARSRAGPALACRAGLLFAPCPRMGSASAPSMRPRQWSRPPCWMPWATSRSSISLDLGTGTGRMLQLLAPRASRDSGTRCQSRHAFGCTCQSRKRRPVAASSCGRAISMRRHSRATPSIS